MKYTKAIKDGRLSTAKMEVGSSVTGTVKGYEEGKYSSILLLEVNGRDVKVSPSGNLKFKVNEAALVVGSYYTITRNQDGQSKNGFTVTNFDITPGNNEAATSNNQPVTNTTSVKEKLEALRANRGV